MDEDGKEDCQAMRESALFGSLFCCSRLKTSCLSIPCCDSEEGDFANFVADFESKDSRCCGSVTAARCSRSVIRLQCDCGVASMPGIADFRRAFREEGPFTAQARKGFHVYLMVDNYDSFTAMLASYFAEFSVDVLTLRNDDVTAASVRHMRQAGDLEGIIISPGPKNPDECGNCKEIVQWAAVSGTPLLGVCLGHQIIASVYGARVARGLRPMHGKVSSLHANGCGLFQGLPREFPVTRYHSLVVQEETLPSSLKVDARTDDGAVMSLRHERLPLFGVQFHPEAARTQYGHELISNFIDVCVRLKTGSPFDATRDAQRMAQAADCAAKIVCDAQRMAQAADCATRAVCDEGAR